ncbi:endoribonuclease L-PSP [Thermocrinis albus DSM 14484]|uniref:Endoribonuclease L-PSP n=1 Tax=Thermocrinis albus (strain DSM 14484 / JCM 11386 / HI 11/12) TaxID=638303 RepID=D3SL09_THEAH|nr:Rid family detoxifying hydrolase [Thermocrinis albus]ADC89439.1 endoribonuclease L-PSP [Thermocrinis albus DSM 14484]
MKEEVRTDLAPLPLGPYSQAVKAGPFLFLSGQLGIDPTTGKLLEDFRGQVRQALKNVESILVSCGYQKQDVVRVVVYLRDLSLFGEFNEVYTEFFKEVDVKPARTTVGVEQLPLNALVEIEVTAIKL